MPQGSTRLSADGEAPVSTPTCTLLRQRSCWRTTPPVARPSALPTGRPKLRRTGRPRRDPMRHIFHCRGAGDGLRPGG